MVALYQSLFALKKHLLLAIISLAALCFIVLQLRLGSDYTQAVPPPSISNTKTLSAEKIVADKHSKSLNYLASIPVRDGEFLSSPLFCDLIN